MEPNVSQGIFDGLLEKLIKIGFDKSKLDIAKIEAGVNGILDGLEPAVSSPGNLDAVVFNALKDLLHNALAALKQTTPPGPLVVGKVFTQTDATAFLATLGGSIPQVCREKILQYPQIVEALEKLSPEKRLKAASNETVIDRLINILITWGPIFLKIAMLILPFLI